MKKGPPGMATPVEAAATGVTAALGIEQVRPPQLDAKPNEGQQGRGTGRDCGRHGGHQSGMMPRTSIAHRRGDRAVAEVMLDRPRVLPVVGQLVPASAAEGFWKD